MASILRHGAYLPRYRVPVAAIHEFFGRPGRPRARTLATPGLDEDPLTMAFEAGERALGDDRAVGGVIVVTQSPPFGFRKVSATLARALGLPEGIVCLDLVSHAGGLLDAFAVAEARLTAGADPILVVATDYVVSYEERVADTLSAGGATAWLIGSDGGVGELAATARAGAEVYDYWRLGTEPEPRYRLEVLFDAYAGAAKGALGAVAARSGNETSGHSAVCASQPHPQTLRALGRAGVGKEQLENTSFVGEIGNLGAASVGFALALGLDRAQPGQRLLAFGYGGGEGIAQEIEVTAAPTSSGAAEQIEGQEIPLGTFYRWTRGRQVEPH